MNQEQTEVWAREQFQFVNAYLAGKGLLPDQVTLKESRYLPPIVSVWKISLQANQGQVWSIAGEGLPTDHIDVAFADNALKAMQYFSYKWQLKANNLKQSERELTSEEQTLIESLITGAEKLYALTDSEFLWKDEPV